MTSIAFFADETWRGLTRQANVVFALIFKEFMGRASSGAGLLGLFWTLATPIFYALTLSSYFQFQQTSRRYPMQGDNLEWGEDYRPLARQAVASLMPT